MSTPSKQTEKREKKIKPNDIVKNSSEILNLKKCCFARSN
jgi:hypothetical protein